MNETLVAAVKKWENSAPSVQLTTPASEDGDLLELTWQRPAGDFAYITLFPENEQVVIVQHGTYTSPEQRAQRGTERFRCSEIPHKLTNLKNILDTAKPIRPWSYKPDVEIGSVSSLKFR